MQIFYMFYLNLVTYLRAMATPELRGRWSALYKPITSLTSYAQSTISAVSFAYHFVTGITSVLADDSPPLAECVRIDGVCHPLDLPVMPTSTDISSTPAASMISVITTSLIAFNPVLYKDIFMARLEITKAPRNPKESKPARAGIPSVESAHLLTTAASTTMVVQLFTVLGQPFVRYLESANPIIPTPDDLEFYPWATFLRDDCHSLILSWISTTSSLIRVDSIAYIHGDDGASLKELSLWALYFATVLVRSYSKPVVAPRPQTEIRAVLRWPLMIEAPTSTAAKLPSCRFQSHTIPVSPSGLDEDFKVKPLELEDKLDLLPLVLELKPPIQSQMQDAAHPPGPPTINPLHLVDDIDEPGSEVTDHNRSKDLAFSFLSETSSTGSELSHPHLSPDTSGHTVVRSFERISGRRVTPLIHLEYSQVDGVSQVRPSLSLLKAIPMESLPLGSEYNLSFLSQFPAPPKKAPVQSLSFFEKAGVSGDSFLRPCPSPTLDNIRSKESQPMHHLRMCSGPQPGTGTTTEGSSPVPYIHPPISSAPSRWTLLAKKSKQKLKKVSSLLTFSNSLRTRHEKVNAFPKNLSRRGFDKGKRLPELPSPSPHGNGNA